MCLRKLTLSDAENLKEITNDKSILKQLPLKTPFTIEEAIKFIKNSQKEMKKGINQEFGICDCKTNRLMGVLSLMTINKTDRNCELGFWIGKQFRSNGFAENAIKEGLNYAFKELKIKRVFALVYHNNIASCNLLKKIGFIQEGYLRKTTFKQNKWYDEFLFSILKEEF